MTLKYNFDMNDLIHCKTRQIGIDNYTCHHKPIMQLNNKNKNALHLFFWVCHKLQNLHDAYKDCYF